MKLYLLLVLGFCFEKRTFSTRTTRTSCANGEIVSRYSDLQLCCGALCKKRGLPLAGATFTSSATGEIVKLAIFRSFRKNRRFFATDFRLIINMTKNYERSQVTRKIVNLVIFRNFRLDTKNRKFRSCVQTWIYVLVALLSFSCEKGTLSIVRVVQLVKCYLITGT